MLVAIDGAGRVVIPRPIRDRLGIEQPERLEIDEHDGVISLRRPARAIELKRGPAGLLRASSGEDLPEVDADDVRRMLEVARGRRA